MNPDELRKLVLDALPERVRKSITEKWDSDYCTIPNVGSFEIRYGYDGTHEAVAVSLHPAHGRSRRYPIRKDGTINFKKMLEEVIEPLFDARAKFEKEYAAKQEESSRRLAEAKRIGPIVFEKLEPGRAYRKKEHSTFAGGFKLLTQEGGGEGDIWAESEDTCSGTIPFDEMPVERLSEILAILGRKLV